jgi:two-component system alkaline phosphatase synthesis response regulator PhoP
MSAPVAVTKQKILVVDDEPDVLELLEYNLSRAGYQVQTATGGRVALDVAHWFCPDLILVDILMPDMDGIRLCEQLRGLAAFSETKIVFLTARDEEYAQVAAFEAGADSYINKPIRIRVLVKRLEAILTGRRQWAQMQNELRLGELTIDRLGYRIVYQGKTIDLPKKEFELFYFLARHPNQVFSREALVSQLWSDDQTIHKRTVDVYIRRLREKTASHYIRTISGGGYMFSTTEG